MKVKEIMTPNAKTCSPSTNLAEAASFMWQLDCGILPVVADDGKVVGLVTDRDICIGGATRNRNLAEITVGEILAGQVYSCAPDDDLRQVLETMQEQRVRRLPVLTADGKLEGILSINDLTLNAKESAAGRKNSAVSYRALVQTYKAICAHRLPEKQDVKGMKARA